MRLRSEAPSLLPFFKKTTILVGCFFCGMVNAEKAATDIVEIPLSRTPNLELANDLKSARSSEVKVAFINEWRDRSDAAKVKASAQDSLVKNDEPDSAKNQKVELRSQVELVKVLSAQVSEAKPEQKAAKMRLLLEATTDLNAARNEQAAALLIKSQRDSQLLEQASPALAIDRVKLSEESKKLLSIKEVLSRHEPSGKAEAIAELQALNEQRVKLLLEVLDQNRQKAISESAYPAGP